MCETGKLTQNRVLPFPHFICFWTSLYFPIIIPIYIFRFIHYVAKEFAPALGLPFFFVLLFGAESQLSAQKVGKEALLLKNGQIYMMIKNVLSAVAYGYRPLTMVAPPPKLWITSLRIHPE